MTTESCENGATTSRVLISLDSQDT